MHPLILNVDLNASDKRNGGYQHCCVWEVVLTGQRLSGIVKMGDIIKMLLIKMHI